MAFRARGTRATRTHDTTSDDDEEEDASLVAHGTGVRLMGDLARPPGAPVSFAASFVAFSRLWHLSTLKLCFAYIVGIAIRTLLVYLSWEHVQGTVIAQIMEDTNVFLLLSLSAMLFPLVTMWLALSRRQELILAVSRVVAAAATLRTLGIKADYSTVVDTSAASLSDTYVVVLAVLRRNNTVDNGHSAERFKEVVDNLLRRRMERAFTAASEQTRAAAAGALLEFNKAVTHTEMVHLGTYSTVVGSHNAVLFFLYFSLMPAHFVNEFGLHSIYISVGFGFLFMGPLVVAQLIQNPFSGSPSDVMNEDVWFVNSGEYRAARSIFIRLKACVVQCFSVAM